MRIRGLLGGVAGAVAALSGGAAWAENPAGYPVDGQLGFQRPVTSLMEDVIWLDDFLLIIITAISLFVLALLAYVVIKFDRKSNPEPATFTHNAKLEVIWTALPVLILVIIVVPSLRLLSDQLVIPEADVTVKATGHQWYWSYSYPGTEIEYQSYLIGNDALNSEAAAPELAEHGFAQDKFLLAADAPLVVPVGKVVHVLVTAADVLHAFAMPSFGIKIDAVPGRINETWFEARETGTFFGQCSELCGVDHAYMPIYVEVVSEEDYATFLEDPQGFIDALTEERRAGATLAAAN